MEDNRPDAFTRRIQRWHFFGRMWETAQPVMVQTTGDEEFSDHLLGIIERAQGQAIGRIYFSIEDEPYMMCWVEERLTRSLMH